jgi:hypothetical protein
MHIGNAARGHMIQFIRTFETTKARDSCCLAFFNGTDVTRCFFWSFACSSSPAAGAQLAFAKVCDGSRLFFIRLPRSGTGAIWFVKPVLNARRERSP